MVHSFNPRTWEVEAGSSLQVQDQPGPQDSQSYIVRLCLKESFPTQILLPPFPYLKLKISLLTTPPVVNSVLLVCATLPFGLIVLGI